MIGPWVKVCGLTRAEDAIAAVEVGVDLLGLNFAPNSPRCIDIETGRDLTNTIRRAARGRTSKRPVRTVAVMVNPTEEQVREIIRVLDPDVLQFHGEESATFCASFDHPFMKAFRLENPEHARPIPDYLAPPAMGFLIDAWVQGAHGGTGHKLSHETARIALQHPRGFLAGGLTPLNAYDIIRTLHPFGVDVASGVEVAPGIKDRLLMERFVTAAGAACQD